jgi:hypothetical protein
MAGLDLKFLTYRNASDLYWNNIYMAEIQAIADKWAMIPDKITKRRELNVGGIKFYLDPSIPKEKLYAADMSRFIKVHNTDTGEEMIVHDKDGEIRKKYDENNQ